MTTRSLRPAVAAARDSTRTSAEGSLRHALAIGQMEQLDRRVIATYLGGLDRARLSSLLGVLRAGLLWEALGDFLGAEGFVLEDEIAFGRREGGVTQPREHGIELGRGEWLRAPQNVCVFAHRGTEKVVIAFTCEHPQHGEPWVVEVTSTADPERFFEGWQDAARRTNRLRGRAVDATGRLVNAAGTSWADLYVSQELQATLQFHLRRFLRLAQREPGGTPLRRRTGLLLWGAPGTGKTMIGRIMAATCGTSFVWATPRHLVNEDHVVEVMHLARWLAPTVLFLEDIDLLAEDRAFRGGSLVLGELMNQLDGYEGDHAVFTVATTNRLEVVEQALRSRPGRFDRVLEVPPPDSRCRRALLEARLGSYGVAPEDLAWLVESTAGQTGAAIEELANVITVMVEEGLVVGDGPRVADRDLLAAALLGSGLVAGRQAVGFG